MEKTVYGCMDSLLTKIKKPNGGLDPKYLDGTDYSAIQDEVDYLCDTLKIEPVEAVLMSAIVQNAGYGNSEISKIGNWFGLTYLRFQTYVPLFEKMSNKWLIKIKNNSEINIPFRSRRAMKNNNCDYYPNTYNLSTGKIFAMMKNAFYDRKNGWFSESDLMENLTDLVKHNPDSSFSKIYEEHINDLCWNERLLFFSMVNRYVNYNDDEFEMNDFNGVLGDEYEYEDICYDYREEDLELQENGVIEFTSSDGLITKDYCHIKDSIKAEMLADVGGLKKKKSKVANYTDCSTIVPKEMFYNPDEQRQVDTLAELISPERFKQVQDSLKASGLRTGFSCIFYGAPGTGKTETALQLARKSGRGLIVANVSELKNCYVGESEKNVQALFDNYKKMVKESDVAPILLFNEADAIFGIRKTGAADAVDKMENSLQNIILQEMEKLDGILIATTNLTENLDKAFERRFLYKVRFDKPTLKARCSIWQSLIPDLSEEDCMVLADMFCFSGGQIENVARKRSVERILSGTTPSLDKVINFCKEEQMV